MITDRTRLLKRIEVCVTLDPKEPTAMHISIDQVVQYLHEYGFCVPPTQYEALVAKAVKERILGKHELGHSWSISSVAQFLFDLAVSLLTRAEFAAREAFLLEKDAFNEKNNK